MKRSVYPLQKSFTLVELVTVVAIVLVLAAIIALAASRAIEKSKVAQVSSNFRTIKTAALAYYADTDRFPPNDDLYCQAYPHDCSGIDFFQNRANYPDWNGPYLEKWPVPPWGDRNTITQYQWQGAWADYDSDGKQDQSAELHFWFAGPDLIEDKFTLVDQILDDGNLATGNFLWGDTFNPLSGEPKCSSCSFFNVE